MSDLTEAIRRLADADAEMTRARTAAEAAQDAHDKAYAIYREARGRADEALYALRDLIIEARDAQAPEHLVKRPANTAAELLDLDDVGGH